MENLEVASLDGEFSQVLTGRFTPFDDTRGSWQRIWDVELLERIGKVSSLKQVSVSTNPTRGTLRGLHALKEVAQETKAVACLTGEVQDVVVDVRSMSNSWGDSRWVHLRAGDFIVIPPGFAHGFLTLTPDVTLVYMMTATFDATLETAYRWDDPFFNIPWLEAPRLISDKDARHPLVEK